MCLENNNLKTSSSFIIRMMNISDLLLLLVGIVIIVFSFLFFLFLFPTISDLRLTLLSTSALFFFELMGVLLIITGIQFSLQKFLLNTITVMNIINHLTLKERTLLEVIVSNGGELLESKLTSLVSYTPSRLSTIISKLRNLNLIHCKSMGDDTLIKVSKNVENILTQRIK